MIVGCSSLTLIGVGTAMGVAGTRRVMGYFAEPEVMPAVLQDGSLMGRASQLATGLNNTAQGLYKGASGVYSDVGKVRNALESFPLIGEPVAAAFSLFVIYETIQLASHLPKIASVVVKVTESVKGAFQAVSTFLFRKKEINDEKETDDKSQAKPRIRVKEVCDDTGTCATLNEDGQLVVRGPLPQEGSLL